MMNLVGRSAVVVVVFIAFQTSAFAPCSRSSSSFGTTKHITQSDSIRYPTIINSIPETQVDGERTRWTARIPSIPSMSKPRNLARRLVTNKRGKLRKIFNSVVLPAALWIKGPKGNANALLKGKSEPLKMERAGFTKRGSATPAVAGAVAVVGSSVGGLVIKKRKDSSDIVDDDNGTFTDSTEPQDMEERKAEIAKEKIDDLVSKALEKISAVEDEHEEEEELSADTETITNDVKEEAMESIEIPEVDEDMLAIEALTSVRAQAEAVLAAKAEELEMNDDSVADSDEGIDTTPETKIDPKKYDDIEDPGEKAFAILVDLGMVELHPDPDDPDYDHSDDDEYAPEGIWI